jgi:DNA polymerase-3 subunit epsilon
MSTFVAIDFETANRSRDSACAVGLVKCRDGEIVDTCEYLIRPPTREFLFTDIHGLTWNDVSDAANFQQLWPDLRQYLGEADFLVAHNAPFDRGVLNACCDSYGLDLPSFAFECTVQLARRQWSIYPTKLPDVCRELDIELNHHDAGSDAQACARIVLAAQREGWVRDS